MFKEILAVADILKCLTHRNYRKSRYDKWRLRLPSSEMHIQSSADALCVPKTCAAISKAFETKGRESYPEKERRGEPILSGVRIERYPS